MPIMPTYPGVYIEEIPSGVRTITGVATSITAFVGRALRGPVDQPVTVNSFGEFERVFGGLWTESSLGYAVQDFYLNGGSQAIIVRLFAPDADNSTPNEDAPADEAETPAGEDEGEGEVGLAEDAGRAKLDVNGLPLMAASPGAWGNQLRVRIDHDVASDVAERYGLALDRFFNLTVRDGSTQIIEQFRNLTVEESPRQVNKVLEKESSLIRAGVNFSPTGAVPSEHDAEPDEDKTIWEDDDTSTGVSETVTNGGQLTFEEFAGAGKEGAKKGLYALEDLDLFNLLCIPPFPYDEYATEVAPLVGKAAQLCEAHRAFLIVDPDKSWTDRAKAKAGVSEIGTKSKNSALFFPMLLKPNPLKENQIESFAPCGAIAGIFARTDAQRGVWKAPAGTDATIIGAAGLSVPLTDAENGELNPLGINCLRTLPAAGRVVWGARTLQGDDRLASEWKYVPVRRTALFIEESLYRGTQWAVFEPNDEPLWSQLRLNIGAFMQNLFRQGAFQGSTPQEAYLVKCDRETTTQNDINLGIVNVIVGFAPLKPAEFVILKIQQLAGQIAT